MYVEVRKAGKGKKYYLVHSFREAGKVVKLRRYVGSNLSRAQIKKRRARAQEFLREQVRLYREIRNPLRHALGTEELRQLQTLQQSTRVYHLDERQWRHFSQVFSYDTNAIEGSTVTKGEVKKLIETGKVPDKRREDVTEARNVVDAIKFLRQTKEHVSVALIRRLHKICFKGTKPFAGELRKQGVEVAVTDIEGNVIHHGAPSDRVVPLLRELVTWYEKNKSIYPGTMLATIVHNQFEDIHPFQDGNGRVGRLLLNNILIKHGLPPVNIHFKHRKEYYEALRIFCDTGNIRPTIELIIREYKRLKDDIR